MSAGLIKYDAACRALAESSLDLRSQGHPSRCHRDGAYARQAKVRNLEADAIEIRMRATRRLDQLRLAQKETVGLNQLQAAARRPRHAGCWPTRVTFARRWPHRASTRISPIRRAFLARWLSDGSHVADEVVQLVLANADFVGVGDSLFGGATLQTFRYVER